MAWKAIQCSADDFVRTPANAGKKPTFTVRLEAPIESVPGMAAEIREESGDALRAAAVKWEATSANAARCRRLSTELAEAHKQADDLRRQSRELQTAVDRAIYEDADPRPVEVRLAQVADQAKAAVERVARLERLIGAANAEAEAEVKALLEGTRRREVARLDAEQNETAAQLAAMSEGLAGRLFILAEARRKIQHPGSAAEHLPAF